MFYDAETNNDHRHKTSKLSNAMIVRTSDKWYVSDADRLVIIGTNALWRKGKEHYRMCRMCCEEDITSTP